MGNSPVSIQRPTVAVGAPESSLATLMPLARTVTSVEGVFSRHSLKLELAMEDIGLNMLLWATFAKLRALDIFDNDMMALKYHSRSGENTKYPPELEKCKELKQQAIK